MNRAFSGLGLRCYILAVTAVMALGRDSRAQAPTVAEVQITPETMTLGVGQKQALFATAFDEKGNLLPSARFSFRSSDTLIARVSRDGTVEGVKPGLAKIEAAFQGKRASTAVLITGATGSAGGTSRTSAASILTLDPASLHLFPGESARIVAQGLRDDGKPAALGRVTLKSLRPDIARIDTGGVVTGVAPGRTIMQATSGRLMATLPVEISQAEFIVYPAKLSLAPDDTDTLQVLVPSQGNRVMKGLVQWRSADSGVASVSATGVVRGRRHGETEIIASGFDQESRSSVTVYRVPEALVVSPPLTAVIQVPVRGTRQFTAVGEGADSTPMAEVRVAWEVGDSAVASFDPASGVLTAKQVGSTVLTARLPGITPAVWTVQVVPGEIGVEPTRIGLLVGQRTRLSALHKDAGSSGRAPGVRWSSDRPDIARAHDGGVVDALSPGRAVITATTPWGKSASADVFAVGELFISSNRDGNFGIYQLRLPGGTTMHPVLVDTVSNIQPALAPDRTRVAFSSNRNGNFDIYVMDADGQNLRRVTSSTANEGDPAWAPDGERIVYTSTVGTATQIAVLSLDGSESRQLTTASGGNHSPAVSPDGKTIAFVSARAGNHAIYAMDLDGRNQRRLTRGSARETSPRFFPNGDLAYVVERGGSSRGSQVIRRPLSGSSSSRLLETEQPIASLALSRDGERLAYVIGRIKDAARGRVEFNLFLQTTAPRSKPVAVPLRPGEQILSPSF